MKAVENIIKFCEENVNQDFNSHRGAYFNVIKFCKEQAKEMESQQQGYSEEEVLPLLEILEKCKEYFLLKTDAKSEERADAIGQAIEDFKKLKNKR